MNCPLPDHGALRQPPDLVSCADCHYVRDDQPKLVFAFALDGQPRPAGVTTIFLLCHLYDLCLRRPPLRKVQVPGSYPNVLAPCRTRRAERAVEVCSDGTNWN